MACSCPHKDRVYLSDFARFGTVWATKNFVSKLSPEERSRVEFGINRRNEGDSGDLSRRAIERA